MPSISEPESLYTVEIVSRSPSLQIFLSKKIGEFLSQGTLDGECERLWGEDKDDGKLREDMQDGNSAPQVERRGVEIAGEK